MKNLKNNIKSIIGEEMKIKDARLVISATSYEQYPSELPAIALAGRSNVGKSSLINTVLGRKSLARTSSTPGKTRTINFYIVNEAFYLVDLPGYGYAKLSKKEKEKWSDIMEEYFERANIRCLFLLLDIRHEPKDSDLQMLEFCYHYNIPVEIIATKSDKLTKNQLSKNIAMLKRELNLNSIEHIHPHSSLNRAGTEEILELISEIIGYEE